MRRDTLIIGGTGTLGTALLEKIDPRRCIVFSRDELKQNQLKRQFPTVRCILGDIRDKSSLARAYSLDIDRVFHVAALKHVDILEENPEEAYKTNVLGTVNSAELAIENEVPEFYFSSTDKAVLPVNVYGMTKGISERYLLNLNEQQPLTTFKVFRWGNIIGSRGSVVSIFANSIRNGHKISLTDERMTRFWLRIEDAVDFMLHADIDETKVNYPPMKAAKVVDLAYAINDSLGFSDELRVNVVGLRRGEKLHECMDWNIEKSLSSDTAPQYTHEELMDLVGDLV